MFPAVSPCMSGVGRGIPRPWHKAEYDRKRESSRYLLLKYYLGRMDYQRAMVYFILCSDLWLVCLLKHQKGIKTQIRCGAVMPYNLQMEEVNFGYIPGHGACRRRSFSGGAYWQMEKE